MPRKSTYSFSIALLTIVGMVVVFQVFRQPVYRLFADFLSPCLTLSSNTEKTLIKTINRFKTHHNLAEENVILQNELESLRGIEAAYNTLKNDHDKLRKLNQLPPLEYYKYRTAQVILRDPASWGVKMSINLGLADGVEKGAPVLTNVMIKDDDGNITQKMVVIGRLTGDISSHSSVVQTLLDPQCSLSVYMPKSKLPAMIQGGFEDEKNVILKASHIPLHQPIIEGEGVYTSGFTPFTPPGLYVGKVVKNRYHQLLETQNNLYAIADIELAADMRAIRYVIIPVRANHE